jgi:hypothetical protein
MVINDYAVRVEDEKMAVSLAVTCYQLPVAGKKTDNYRAV